MNVIRTKNLNTPRPSAEWIREARRSLTRLVGSGNPLVSVICDETSPQRHAVHRIWSLGLTSLVDLKSLENWKGRPMCWRFVASGHKSFEAGAGGCWAIDDAEGAHPRVVSISQGHEMSGLLRDAELLNDADQFRDHEYDLQVLRIPALYLEAFWLKCRSNHDDWVVPYGLIRGGESQEYIKLHGKARLTRNKPYKASAFLNVVQGVARQRLSAPDITRPQPPLATEVAERGALRRP